MKRNAIWISVAIGAALVIGYGLFKSLQPTPLVFQGQIEAKEVDIAAKVPGRIRVVRVRLGDVVSVGDVLFELDSPELTAKMAQASAGRDAAEAMQDKADTGAREEEIRMARFAWSRAQSAAELAQTSYQRYHSLYIEGLIAEQKDDEAATNAKAAADAALAARAQYDMALNGARSEDKQAAHALVGQAEGLVAEVAAYRAETELTAPIGGEVSGILIDAGELAPTGFPVITLVDLSDIWAVLNVREDHLANFRMNATVMGTVPALGDRQVTFSVYYIAPMADFATWHATRYSSGYDIKTFEVRLRPSDAIDGLRPGMSVLIEY
ncbi:MAG: efflux RND transporter periplasmic adaptor subunit [Woeseiaceae bacterium]|nr:efflux RND transporter periplasmic adaptor subunit [Woeseiaceae bacterium]